MMKFIARIFCRKAALPIGGGGTVNVPQFGPPQGGTGKYTVVSFVGDGMVTGGPGGTGCGQRIK